MSVAEQQHSDLAWKAGAEQVLSFEGISEYTDDNTAEDRHAALKHAAAKASAYFKEIGEPLPQLFNVTEEGIMVGNPHVKMYRVVITAQTRRPIVEVSSNGHAD